MSARRTFEELTADGTPEEKWERIEQLVRDGEPESLWLDFKEVAPDATPHENYIKDKLARSLSAFANTAGGVLVYGISTKEPVKQLLDRARATVPIRDAGIFRAKLEKLSSKLVDPFIEGLITKEVIKPNSSGSGVVVVYVPQSDGGPHRVQGADSDSNDRYFVRSNTDNMTMSHVSLADRFGRTATPKLRLEMRMLKFEPATIELRLHNVGRGAARRPAVQIMELSSAYQLTPYAPDPRTSSRFFVTPSETSSGRTIYSIEREDDHIVFPGTDCVVAYIRSAFSGFQVADASFGIKVVLYALDMQPIRAAGMLATYAGESIEECQKRIVRLPE